MKASLRILGKFGLGLAVLLALGILFVYSGIYNVAATKGHARPLEQVLRLTMMRSVVAHAREIHPPATFDPLDHALVETGAGHYEAMCRTCHGAPGKKPDPWQLYPPPPDLADALRVTGWSDPEVYWIIKNGIKDTGMSAFGSSAADDEIWALTAFVRQLKTITPEQYFTMTKRAPMKEGSGHASQSHGSDPVHPPMH